MNDVHDIIKEQTDALRDLLTLLQHSPVADGVVEKTEDSLDQLDSLTAQLRVVDDDQDADNPTDTKSEE